MMAAQLNSAPLAFPVHPVTENERAARALRPFPRPSIAASKDDASPSHVHGAAYDRSSGPVARVHKNAGGWSYSCYRCSHGSTSWGNRESAQCAASSHYRLSCPMTPSWVRLAVRNQMEYDDRQVQTAQALEAQALYHSPLDTHA